MAQTFTKTCVHCICSDRHIGKVAANEDCGEERTTTLATIKR